MADILRLKKKAADFEAKKQLDKALATYREMIEVYESGEEEPIDIPLYNRVGDLLQKAGNLPEAVSLWERAVDHYSDGGFYNPAIALCNKILRQSPGRAVVYYKLGKISAEKGFKGDARQNFLEYASRMQKAGNLDEAFRALKEFADLVPDQDDVRLMLADQLVKADRKKEAIDQLQIAYAQLVHEGRDTDAEEVADKMRAIDPSVEPKAGDGQSESKGGGLVFLDLEPTGGASAGRKSTATPPVLAKRVSKAIEGLDIIYGGSEPAPAAPARPAASAPKPPELVIEPTAIAPPEPPPQVDLIVEPTAIADVEVPEVRPILDPPPVAPTGPPDDLVIERTSAPEIPTPRGSLVGLESTSLIDLSEAVEEPAKARTLEASDLPMLDEPVTTPADLSPREERVATPSGLPLTAERAVPPETLPVDEAPLPMTAERAVPPSGRADADRSKATPSGGMQSSDFGTFGASTDTPAESEAVGFEALELESAQSPFFGDLNDDAKPSLVEDEPAPLFAALDEIELEDEPPTPRATSTVLANSVDLLRDQASDAPEDWGLRRQLAEALLDDGQREEGIAELEVSLAGYERDGDLDTAASIAEEIVRLAPTVIRFHQKRVEFAFRANDRLRLAEAYVELADALLRDGQAPKARVVYQRVLEISPDDLRAQAALETIADTPVPEPAPAPRRSVAAVKKSASVAAPKPRSKPKQEDDDEFISLGDWLRDEEEPKSTRMVVEEKEPTGDEQADFADMLRKFKQGVSDNVDDEDHEAHYDLGVAYKEMGLLDEAISEFQKALRGATNRVRSIEALGLCFVEKQQLPVAATILHRALTEPGVRDDDLIGVLYLLGTISEELHLFPDAKKYYERIFAVDIQFRDIGDRMTAVESQLK